jgi:cyclic pyranopterin phosphate synthase
VDFTHFDKSGRPKMIDVSEKSATHRVALAEGSIHMKKETLDLMIKGGLKKGDVLFTAQLAAIMAAKRTSEIIPMCHNIALDGVEIDFEIDKDKNLVNIKAMVSTTGKTGVEMEALTAVAVCALTIYDMCKAVDKEMVIGDIRLLKKTGGKSDYGKDSID